MFAWSLGQSPASASTFRVAPLIGLPHRAYLDGPGKPADLPVLLITGTSDSTVPPGRWRNPYYTITSDGDVFYYASATAITRVWARPTDAASPPMRRPSTMGGRRTIAAATALTMWAGLAYSTAA